MYHEIELSEEIIARVMNDGHVLFRCERTTTLLTDEEMRELVAGWVELDLEYRLGWLLGLLDKIE